MSATEFFEAAPHDPQDPNPWLALFLDTSVPFSTEAKAALLKDGCTRSRQFILPLVRPLARITIVLLQVVKIFVPRRFTSTRILHETIYHGLRTFVSPEANYLIIRHFNIGSEILAFIAANVPGVTVPLHPLKPKCLEDLRDNMFLQHDLNIYNFIIRLNKELREKGIELQSRNDLRFDMITDDSFDINVTTFSRHWTNILDLETAIEMYTPLYQLLLTDSDFWRACNSLQLDETVALYAARLLGDIGCVSLVNNKHPMVPMSTLQAGHRLMLHGLAAESLHACLVRAKRHAAKQLKIETADAAR